MMDAKVRKTVLDLFKFVAVFDVFFALLTFFLFDDAIRLIFGLIFGSAIAALCFAELALTLSKSVRMSEGRANAYVSLKYYLRLLIYGVVIFVSIKSDNINVIGTVIGLLSVKVMIYITNIIVKKNS